MRNNSKLIQAQTKKPNKLAINTIVISGSVSMQKEMKGWVSYWQTIGYDILDWPRPIEQSRFLMKWPKVHRNFYRALEKTAVHFIANEKKDGQPGYIGNGVFAEISFSTGLNLIREKKIKIILLHDVSKENKFYPDIELWMKKGWLGLFNCKNYHHGKRT